jgi:hypothetical protein
MYSYQGLERSGWNDISDLSLTQVSDIYSLEGAGSWENKL